MRNGAGYRGAVDIECIACGQSEVNHLLCAPRLRIRLISSSRPHNRPEISPLSLSRYRLRRSMDCRAWPVLIQAAAVAAPVPPVAPSRVSRSSAGSTLAPVMPCDGLWRGAKRGMLQGELCSVWMLVNLFVGRATGDRQAAGELSTSQCIDCDTSFYADPSNTRTCQACASSDMSGSGCECPFDSRKVQSWPVMMEVVLE